MLKQLLIAAAVAGFVPCMGQDIEIAVGPWSTGDSWGSFHQIAADKFVSVAADDCLTIFYNAGSGAQAQIYAPRKEGRVNPNSAPEAIYTPRPAPPASISTLTSPRGTARPQTWF